MAALRPIIQRIVNQHDEGRINAALWANAYDYDPTTDITVESILACVSEAVADRDTRVPPNSAPDAPVEGK